MDTPGAILKLDAANARVRFSVRWFGILNVRGTFDEVTGTVELPSNGEEPNVAVAVDSQSVHTGISLRDRHLRGLRFLDSLRHPQIEFQSDRASRHNGVWDVRGRLKLRGHERQVSMTLHDEAASPTERRFTALFRVPRRPHAIGTAHGIRRLNPLLWAIGDEVALEVEVTVPATLVSEHDPGH
jgi:polyisoprenoid-binding protein YceI